MPPDSGRPSDGVSVAVDVGVSVDHEPRAHAPGSVRGDDLGDRVGFGTLRLNVRNLHEEGGQRCAVVGAVPVDVHVNAIGGAVGAGPVDGDRVRRRRKTPDGIEPHGVDDGLIDHAARRGRRCALVVVDARDGATERARMIAYFGNKTLFKIFKRCGGGNPPSPREFNELFSNSIGCVPIVTVLELIG